MSMRRLAGAVTTFAVLSLAPPQAGATQKFGPVQLSGNLQTLNIARHPDQDSFQYVMRGRCDRSDRSGSTRTSGFCSTT